MSRSDLGFIHRFEPGQSKSAAPVLLLLHGTGSSEDDLLPLGRSLLPDASLLSPRGQVLEAGAPRFFRRLAEGVFDLEDLQARTHHLADFIESAAAAYNFERSRVVAVGYSNGANIAASLLLLRPQVLAGAILLRPMVPLVSEPLPALPQTPIFIAAARHDPLVAPSESERLAALLRSAGARVELNWAQAGHNLTPEELDAARSWLELRAVANAL